MGVRDFWENAAPKTKRFVMAGGAISIFVAFAAFVAVMDRSKPKPKPGATTSNTTVMMPSRKNTDLEGVAATQTAMMRRLQQLESDRKTDVQGFREEVKQLREQLVGKESGVRGDHSFQELESKLAILQRKVEEGRSVAVQPSPEPKAPVKKIEALDRLFPPQKRSGAPGSDPTTAQDASEVPVERQAPVVFEPKLRIIGAEASASEKGNQGGKAGPMQASMGSGRDLEQKPSNADAEYVYLPMGAMVKGVLLNGLDAPTSGAAVKNPTPALVRVKHDALLPNHAKLDIKECFILVSGHGVMSTERANLRTEGMSCVRDDGGVVEVTLDGYATGEDGKVGLRGRLVSKQGSVIAQSLASGFFSGLGKALQPSGVVGVNLNPGALQQTQNVDLGTAFESGVFGGASSSLNQISKFYLDIAKEMVPVVEIDAGRPVTIILTKGARLRFNRV